MFQIRLIKGIGASIIGSLLLFACNQTQPSEQAQAVRKASTEGKSLFTDEIKDYYVNLLDSCSFYIAQMDSSVSRAKNQALLTEARKWYKLAEPIIIAYDHENYKTINAPNLLKIEIDDYTDIKRIKPHSFQVLEEVLYAEDELDKGVLRSNIDFLSARVPFIAQNHIIYTQTDQHHLKMIRDAIVNIATKGITGFDSPMLANSMTEAVYNYQSMRNIIEIFEEAFNDKTIYEAWLAEFESVIKTLEATEFDDFDRYAFIKNHTNKQLELINQTADDWGIEIKLYNGVNPRATQIFSKEFFVLNKFAPAHTEVTDASIALGKRLFKDNNLSIDGKLSCASCHHDDKALTDGLKKAMGNDGNSLARNTPTLKYAVYQRKFFYDAVSSSLEGQIINVLDNPKEFHTDFSTLEKKVTENQEYKAAFDSIYQGNITARNIRNAIADYVRSQAPFDSKFDRNMQGKEESLTAEEKKGFNLFMGKASCGTCHFAPTFFGTVPPKFDETELENLGVPANADFQNPVLDSDIGAYEPYKVEERKFFFKTSTVRNIALTAPYMHNGVYETLEEVIEFYNAGGGAGMGLDNPYQTLPADSLHLTEEEKAAIIAFMKTLTDQEQ